MTLKRINPVRKKKAEIEMKAAEALGLGGPAVQKRE